MLQGIFDSIYKKGADMKKTIFFISLMLSVLFFACQNKNEQPASKTNETAMKKDTSKVAMDSTFLDAAAQGGIMMVQLGNIAEKKAHNKEIKDFANMMISDHSKINDELKSLAQKNNINLPDSPGKDKQDKINDLEKLSGRKFEKQYVDMMAEDHENDIAKFKEESQSAVSPEVRQWAAETLPTLQKHLDKIKEIQKKYRL
jgi:putative membrane protein